MKGTIHFGALAINDESVVLNVHDELREHRAEQIATDMVRHSIKKFDRVRQHVDVGEDEFGAVVESLLRLNQLLLDNSLLQGYLFESFPQLVDSHRAVWGKLDQAVFLRFELHQLGPKALFYLEVGCVKLVDGLGDFGADGIESVRSEAFDGDSLCHCRLKIVHPDGAKLAAFALFTGTDPVLVGAAIARPLAVDESTLLPFAATAAAVHHSLQVVKVDEVTVALSVAAAQDLLAGEERFFADDRPMASGVVQPSTVDLVGHRAGRERRFSRPKYFLNR